MAMSISQHRMDAYGRMPDDYLLGSTMGGCICRWQLTAMCLQRSSNSMVIVSKYNTQTGYISMQADNLHEPVS